MATSYDNAAVVAESRLQDAIDGPARATVLSVSGLLGEVFALTVFGFAALVGSRWSMPVVVGVLALCLPVIAVCTSRWLPPRAGAAAQAPDDASNQVVAQVNLRERSS